jgi:hypothetical protein
LIEQIDENQSVPTNESTNMLELDQWDTALSRITGTIYRGTERISTREILQVLGCSERETKLIAKRMRSSGWSGPKPIRIMGTNGKSVVASGYERKLGKAPTVVDQSEPVRGDLPSKLEAVTRLALREVGKVLKAPFDASDGVLTRNKVTAALGAVNAQLKADQQQLRRKTQGDVLQRLLKIIEEERKALAAPLQQVEHVELERSDAEASVMAPGVDGSEEG